ncbi:MAG: retropepsin-like aspartic protease [Nitrososphaerales archaeon]
MGMIRQLLLVKGDKKEEKLSVLFDSGVSRSLIRNDVAKEISTPKKLLIQREFTVANGHKVVSSYFCDLIIEIEGKRIGIEAFLVEDLPVPLVFGVLDMEAYMIKLDLVKRKLDLSEFTGYMLAI